MKAKDLLTSARELARNKEYKEAAKAFASYLEEQEEQEPQIMLELGFALLLAGDRQGAVIVYETLTAVFQGLAKVPSDVAQLWDKFSNLVAGARRKLVLTGVSAALLVTSAAASDKAFSAHRYSGGVIRPTISLDDFSFDKPKPEKPMKPSFSAHRYSGGVLQPTQLEMFADVISKNSTGKTTSTSATQKTTGTKPVKPLKPGKPGKPNPTVVPITLPITKPPVRPGFSAHRYSGGVYLNREEIFKRKEFPLDEEAISRRKRIELELRKRRLRKLEKK